MARRSQKRIEGAPCRWLSAARRLAVRRSQKRIEGRERKNQGWWRWGRRSQKRIEGAFLWLGSIVPVPVQRRSQKRIEGRIIALPSSSRYSRGRSQKRIEGCSTHHLGSWGFRIQKISKENWRYSNQLCYCWRCMSLRRSQKRIEGFFFFLPIPHFSFSFWRSQKRIEGDYGSSCGDSHHHGRSQKRIEGYKLPFLPILTTPLLEDLKRELKVYHIDYRY